MTVDIQGGAKKTGPSYRIAHILKTPWLNWVEILQIFSCVLTHYNLLWWRHTDVTVFFYFVNFIEMLLSFIHTVQIDLSITKLLCFRYMAPQSDGIFKQKVNDCVHHILLQKFTNFHAIRSWSFQNICSEIGWPRFCATLYTDVDDRCHWLMEPFVMSAMRQLSLAHPVYKLLKPYFRYTSDTHTYTQTHTYTPICMFRVNWRRHRLISKSSFSRQCV